MLQIASYFLIQILIRHDASKWIRKHRNTASVIIKRPYANWRQKNIGVKKRISTTGIFLARKSEIILIFHEFFVTGSIVTQLHLSSSVLTQIGAK